MNPLYIFAVRLLFGTTLLLFLAVLFSLLLRKRPAALRHRVWSSAISGVLVLPFLLPLLPAVPIGVFSRENEEVKTEMDPFIEIRNDSPENAAVSLPGENAVLELSPPFEILAERVVVYHEEPATGGTPPIQDLHQSSKRAGDAGGTPPESPGETSNEFAQLKADRFHARAQAAFPRIDLLLAAVWISGSVLFLVRFALSLYSVRKVLRRLSPIDDASLDSTMREIAQRLDIRRPVRLLQNEVGDIPFAVGIRRPAVVLPAEIVEGDRQRLCAVLTHELGHVKRNDVVWQFLCNIAAAIYWFHPLVWLALRQIRVEREIACDDLVLLAGEKPSDYASVLLDIAENLKTRDRRHFARYYMLGCTVAMARKNAVRKRIVSILDPMVRRRPPGKIVSFFALLFAVTGILVAATLSPQAAEESKSKAPDDKPVVESETPPDLREIFEQNRKANERSIAEIEAEAEKNKPDLETLQQFQDQVAEFRKRSLEVESLYKAGAVGGSAGDLAKAQIDLAKAEIELYGFTGEQARRQTAIQIRNEAVQNLAHWSKSAFEAGTITKEELAEAEKLLAEIQVEAKVENEIPANKNPGKFVQTQNHPLRNQHRIFKWTDDSPQTDLPFPDPKVDERFELLCIVFRLAGAREFRCREFRIYNDAIEKHFADFKDHEVVRYAKQLYNPFWGGSIGQDRVPMFAAHCTIRDGHVLLTEENADHLVNAFKDITKTAYWTKRNSQKFISLLDDFYVKSRFREFFESQSGIYRTAEKRFLKQARWADFSWFDRFFGTKCVDGYGLVLLMVSEDGGFGRIKSLDENGQKRICDAIGVRVDPDGMPYYEDDYIYISLLQYASTGFAEALGEKYFPQMKEKAELLDPVVARRILATTSTSTNAKRMIVNYIGYGAVYKYLEKNADPAASEWFLGRYQGGGFVWLDRLVEELDRYEQNRDEYPTLDDFMPEIVKLQDSIITDEYIRELRESMREATKAGRPRFVSANPPNGAVNVDPNVTEISVTFDRPMQDNMAWCSADGNATFPKSESDEFPVWSDDYKTCTMREVRLEPGKTYNIWLNLGEHDGFTSREGVSLTPVRYTFSTAKSENIIGKPERETVVVERMVALKEKKAVEDYNWAKSRFSHEIPDLEQAIKHLDDAIRLKPDFVDAYLERARKRHVLCTQYLLDGRFQGENHDERRKKELEFLSPALADCNEAIRLAPENAKSYSIRSRIHIAMGNSAAKFDDEIKAIELDPRSEYYASRGSTFSVVQYDTAAYADLIEAKKRIKDHEKGLGYHEKTWKEVVKRFGGKEKAEAVYRDFSERKIDYVKAYRHHLQSEILYRQARPVPRPADFKKWDREENRGLLEKALAESDAAIQIDPGFDEFWNQRGRIHGSLGNTDDAIRDYTEGIRLRPDRGDYWARANLYGKKGEYRLELDDLDEEIRIRKPDDVWLRSIKESRERVLKKLGETEDR